MIKLAKYLKPFIKGLLLAIILLFGQAICDLSLPNYMSDIVNVGIQQNGLENTSPEALSVNGMKLLSNFMTEDDKVIFINSYSLVNVNDKNIYNKEYLNIYPLAKDELFVRKNLESIELLKVDKAFNNATYSLVKILRDTIEGDTNNKPKNSKDLENAKIDINQLYNIPDIAISSLVSNNQELINSSFSKSSKQIGYFFTKIFLSEIGISLITIQTNYVIKVGLKMLLTALLGGIATILVSLISTRIATGVSRDLRKSIFSKVQSFSNAELDKFSTSSLITRTTNDITQIQMFLMMGIRFICYAPIMAIGGIIMAINKSSSMSWIIALACIMVVGLISIVMSIAVPKFKVIQKLVDRLNLVSRENLSGLSVIRAFSTQNYEKKRFEKSNFDLANTNLYVNRIMTFMMPAMTLIMNGVTIVIIWVGSNQVASSLMQVGDMMGFMQYAMQIIMSFLMISMTFVFLPRASVSGERISEVLSTELSIKDPEKPEEFNKFKKGILEFKNVHFRYHDAEVDAINNISFVAKPGQTTAIIGSTGSGKSTIASLALRFYDVSKGEIFVDGVDIRNVLQKDLREKIGYVPQKGVLISGTIESNLKYGKKNADISDMQKAATISQAINFINKKENGFLTEISQGGSNVSGGQKQRLSIARALIKTPDILIFDDSFSALDFKTDSLLRKALKEHTGNSTVIVVTQRVSTIKNAEQIIVLDHGSMVGIGTHEELIKNCPEYFEIASSQLSKEELA